MDIMDDVLDLMDSLGETLEKGKRTAKRLLRGQSGFSTLVTVLVIMALGAIVITPVLAFVVTGQRAGATHKETTHRYYAADTGIQDGMYKVSSGDLPLWMKDDWDESVYSHAADDDTLYQLPDQVNGNDVTVRIQAMWLLEGLETPSADQHRTPDNDLVTVSNIIGAGQLQVVIVCGSPTTTSLNRIGVWIPQGFGYTVGSSTLEMLPESDPAHCHPTVSEWRNGHTVIFDYGTPVAFDDFPGVTGSRMVLSFDYTPGPGMTTCWSWCRTTGTNPKLAWSDDIKLYQVESKATNPETGQSTSVISHTMTNESIGTYLAYYGDYAATGNGLMRDADHEGYYRERLYKETPGEVSVIPTSGDAKRILLYWSGWKTFPEDVFYGGSTDVDAWPQEDQDRLQALAANYRVDKVSLRIEYNSHNYVIGTVTVDPDNGFDKSTVLPNGSPSSPNGWSYGCKADVTELVKDYFEDIGVDFVGNGKYWIGHADLGASPPDTDTIQGIWGSSSSNVFIVGDSGTILRYDGTDWTTQSSGITRSFKGVWGSGANYAGGDRVYAVGERRNVRMYNGSTWTSIDSSTSSTSATLYGVWGTGASDVFVVGSSGTIRRWGGSSWTAMTSGTTQELRGIWGSGGNWAGGDRVYAVGLRGSSAATIRRYDGTNWASVTTGAPRVDLYGVWGTAWNNVFAVGASGTILRYNGTTWATMGVPSGFTSTLYGVWGSGANYAGGDRVYAAGADGRVLQYNGSGGWSEMVSGCIEHLYGAWGSGPSDVYAVGVSTGTASTILHYDGSVWNAVTSGYQVYGWVNNHSGETVVGQTAYRLGDNTYNQWANGAWSVVVLYTSPVTLAHQMYLYDTFGYWNSNDDRTFDIEGFLAPAGIASESDAVRITCFVGEGDSVYTGDNIYLNGHQLNTFASGNALASNNVWNGVSNSGGVTGFPPDSIDIDTFTIDGHSGWIMPADSSATVRLRTGTDIWNLVYMILSFRSDKVGSGLVTYIVK
jgi:hypothetical protein